MCMSHSQKKGDDGRLQQYPLCDGSCEPQRISLRNFKYTALGAATGGVLGAAADYACYKFLGVAPNAVGASVTGVMAGGLISGLVDSYRKGLVEIRGKTYRK